jgi:hypothetical protein
MPPVAERIASEVRRRVARSQVSSHARPLRHGARRRRACGNAPPLIAAPTARANSHDSWRGYRSRAGARERENRRATYTDATSSLPALGGGSSLRATDFSDARRRKFRASFKQGLPARNTRTATEPQRCGHRRRHPKPATPLSSSDPRARAKSL